MLDQSQDWRGEHLIRSQKKDYLKPPGWNFDQLKARREKMKGLVAQGLGVQAIADELGITKNATYTELRLLKQGKI